MATNFLIFGNIYTRQNLIDHYGITDATINNGIFQRKGENKIWLFVTEKKTSDRTQYQDFLNGDKLNWDGQTQGRRDRLIINHEAEGNEIHLFYRKRKYEYPGAGFRYEGKFRYDSHIGSHPAHFIFYRVDDLLQTVKEDLQSIELEATDPEIEGYPEGTQKTLLINKYERDPRNRAEAIRIHGTTCQACGFKFEEVYGEHGKGYIHVHHHKPISSYNSPVNINPATDLCVLCANCHSMIHRRPKTPLTLDQLRILIHNVEIN